MAEKKSEGFSKAEREAMKERARELKKEKAQQKREEAEAEVVGKLEEMPEPDRTIGLKVHEIITKTAPDLVPRTWYGMPAYARDGKVVCFFQGASKFDTRYSTLGFNDTANLDEGSMWPTTFAITRMTASNEKAIKALVQRAISRVS
jgi:uncharacterized protein YdhG (YjbR/CyaY superfamily)